MTFGIESDALPERERLRNTSGKSSAHVMAHRIRPREGKPYSERIAPLLEPSGLVDVLATYQKENDERQR